MRLRNLRDLALGLVLTLGASVSAHAFTLTDLVTNNGSFVTSNGLLFDNFTAIINGPLSHNLDHYTVTPTATGFDLTGAFGVADGELGDMFLTYTVLATDNAIADATLFFNGQTLPIGVTQIGASVAEDYFNGQGQLQGSNFVARTGGGLDQPLDTVVFAQPQVGLYVEKDILVDSLSLNGNQQPILGTIAAISLVRQSYGVVPEPGTMLLVTAGLAGLTIAGRKRA